MKKNRILIIIVSTLLVILLVVMLLLSLKPKEKVNKNKLTGNYNISNKKEELPGRKEYNSDSGRQCIDGICVDNVKLYYDDDNNDGRLECSVINTTKKVKSGYLKLVYDSESIIIVYDKVKASEQIETSAQFDNKDLKNKTNYKLKKLSKEELSKIKK